MNMKHIWLFSLVIGLLASVEILAQDEYVAQNCQVTSKVDEFEFKNLPDAKKRVELFGLQIKNSEATAIIIGYGGKATESGQGQTIAREIGDFLTDKYQLGNTYRIQPRDGGHRSVPTVELFIKPQSCSDEPEATPSLSRDEVDYKEEKEFFSKDTIRKNDAELNRLIVEQTDPTYPPAAKAVRASGKVLLLIEIDEQGQVTKAKALDGHPLLRNASEGAIRRNVVFQALEVDGKAVKYGGKFVLDWWEIAKRAESVSEQ